MYVDVTDDEADEVVEVKVSVPKVIKVKVNLSLSYCDCSSVGLYAFI